MGLLDRFKDGGYLAKFGLVFLSFACLFAWVAFTGTGWLNSGNGKRYGLWVACYDTGGTTHCRQEYGGQFWDRWSVVQASATCSFLGTNAALVLTILYTVVRRLKHNKHVAAITGAICIGTGFVNLCGLFAIMTVFTAEFVQDFDTHLVWVRPSPGDSFYLSWVAMTLEVLAGILVLRDATLRRKRELRRRKFHWTELYIT